MNIKQALVAMFLGVCFMQTPIFAALNSPDSRALKIALSRNNAAAIKKFVDKYSVSEIESWLNSPAGQGLRPQWQRYLQATGQVAAPGKKIQEPPKEELAGVEAQVEKALQGDDIFSLDLLINQVRAPFNGDALKAKNLLKGDKKADLKDFLNRLLNQDDSIKFYATINELLYAINNENPIQTSKFLEQLALDDENYVTQHYFKTYAFQEKIETFVDKEKGSLGKILSMLQKAKNLNFLLVKLTTFITDKLKNLNVNTNKKILKDFVGPLPDDNLSQYLRDINQGMADKLLAEIEKGEKDRPDPSERTDEPGPSEKKDLSQVEKLTSTAVGLAKEITEKLSKSSLTDGDRNKIAVQWGFKDFDQMKQVWGS